MKLRKKLLGAGVAAVLALGASSAAHAIAYGDAILRIIDFQFEDANTGNALTLGSGFSVLSANNTGNADADLRGTDDDDSGAAGLGGTIDLLQVCIGDCAQGTGANEYTPLSTQGGLGLDGAIIPTSDVAFAEADLTGAAINIPGQVAAGADADTRGTAALQGSGLADANSNLGLNTRFLISAATTIDLGFSFDYDVFLRALLTPDEVVDGIIPEPFVQSNVAWDISITDVATQNVLNDEAPDEVNAGRSASLGGDDFESTDSGSYTYSNGVDGVFATLLAGQQYEIVIRHSSNVDIGSVVPAPGALLLLGSGLFGLAAVRRRRSLVA